MVEVPCERVTCNFEISCPDRCSPVCLKKKNSPIFLVSFNFCKVAGITNMLIPMDYSANRGSPSGDLCTSMLNERVYGRKLDCTIYMAAFIEICEL